MFCRPIVMSFSELSEFLHVSHPLQIRYVNSVLESRSGAILWPP